MLKLINLVSPAQQRARAELLEKSISSADIKRFERFFEKRQLLNIKMEKPNDGAKFGLSFFDGGAAWAEIHRR